LAQNNRVTQAASTQNAVSQEGALRRQPLLDLHIRVDTALGVGSNNDALPLLQARSSKGPTAEELKALTVQKAWLEKHINWKSLRSLAYRNIRDAVIGREIVRELYHDMLQWTPEELQGLRSPQAYANMAVNNRLSNWRRRFPQADPLPDDYENPDEVPSLEEVLETRDQVVELLGDLPKKWLEPWLLCRYYGYSNAEAAQELGLTVDAVKKRVLRGGNHLQMLLAAAPPPPSPLERVKNFIQRKERHHGK
jgi:DNA-directed RNA polymerase specialized sigma24 family protein